MSGPNASVQALVAEHDHLTYDAKYNKVHCAITGLDIVCRLDAVEQHLRSKRFRKEREWYAHDFSAHEPFIVAHKFDRRKLYCNVTRRELNRVPAEVARHVAGKKYQRQKKVFEAKRARRAEMEMIRRQREEAKANGEFYLPDDFDPSVLDPMQESEDEEGGGDDEREGNLMFVREAMLGEEDGEAGEASGDAEGGRGEGQRRLQGTNPGAGDLSPSRPSALSKAFDRAIKKRAQGSSRGGRRKHARKAR